MDCVIFVIHIVLLAIAISKLLVIHAKDSIICGINDLIIANRHAQEESTLGMLVIGMESTLIKMQLLHRLELAIVLANHVIVYADGVGIQRITVCSAEIIII